LSDGEILVEGEIPIERAKHRLTLFYKTAILIGGFGVRKCVRKNKGEKIEEEIVSFYCLPALEDGTDVSLVGGEM
jgi:hypothetical protein